MKPTLSVSTTPIDFGEQRVNATPSQTRTLTVNNTGTGSLEVNPIALSGGGAAHYSVTPSTLSVPANSSRVLTVTFAPTAEGSAPATLTLTSNEVNRAPSPSPWPVSG